MKYREVVKSYEATPSYNYTCFICEGPIKGPYKTRSIYSLVSHSRRGEQVVDVLRNGKIITIHQTCNL